jgi:hypothetical protein
MQRVDRPLLESSLVALLETSPAVTYAGPDPDALGDRLPAPGEREPPEPRPWRARRSSRPEVFVVDLPSGNAAMMSVSIAAPRRDDPAVATLFGRVLQARFVARARGSAGWGRVGEMRRHVHPFGDASFVARAHLAIERIPDATERALASMTGELDADGFAAALRSVEESARAHRVPAHRVPETVLDWPSTTDPRMAMWEHLAAVQPARLEAYTAAAAGVAPALAIGADLDRLDLDALGNLAAVTVVDIERLCLGH